jgi:hypothetical protein
MARLTEAQAAIVIALLEAVFGARELGLTREQQATGRSIVARELPRVVAGASAA